MRIRQSLFAVLVACSSSGQPEQQPVEVTQQQPTPVAKSAPVARLSQVALPAIAVSELPIDQTPAPWTLTASDGSGLVTTRIDAKAVMQGPLAFTELHLYFANTEGRVREGTFAITLPPGAAVSRFAMETNGQWMEAEVVEKQVARRAYEDFLHRKQDPALMEKAAGNQFTARVFPIEANSVKHLVLSFSQELPGQRYVLPLRGLPKVHQLAVALGTTNPDGTRAEQKLEKRDWHPDQDFISTAESSAEAITSGGVVIAQVSPFDQATVRPEVPKAMTLLVDTSASRALGFTRYASVIRELVQALATRYGGITVDVIAFDQDTQTLYSGLASGFGKQHVDALLARGAAGASDISQALAKLEQGRDRVVIVTDGVVTAGSSGSDLAAKVKSLSAGRVDVVMVGGIRDQALATSLVTAKPRTGAVLDLDQRLGEVANGLGESVLSQLSVEVAGASWVWPKVIASARPNQRQMVYARFDKPLDGAIDVRIGDRRTSIKPVEGTGAMIERAAAAAEIVDLEAKLGDTKGDEAKALRASIVKKAVAARVISTQTSMLVLESDSDYGRFGIDRKALADILVVGPKGLELRNRSFVAIKRPPPPPRRPQVGDQKFALKDTTDPEAALRPRDGSERMQGMAVGAGSMSVSRGAVASPRIALKEADEEMDKRKVAEPTKPEPPASMVRPDLPNPSAPNAYRPSRPMQPRDRVITDPSSGGESGIGLNGEQFPPPDAPPPLKGKLAEIDRLIRRGKLDDALVKAQDWHAKQPGDVLALIGLGEALEAKKDLVQAARIYGSIIDLFPGRADLRRFAGERLERVGDNARWLAIDTYRRAVEERPDHMTGHRLLAYALLRNGKHADALAAILKGTKQRYPEDRFEGGMRVLKEDAGLIAAAYLAAAPDKKQDILDALRKHGTSLSTRASTRFIMYWETDANDVDFHIQDARGGHAYYSNTTLPSGGELYADITTGYGPECFTIPGRPTAGPYKISINYYSQGPMGYGMGLLQIIKHDGKGKLEFQDRPYVIMNDEAYVNLGTFR